MDLNNIPPFSLPPPVGPINNAPQRFERLTIEHEQGSESGASRAGTPPTASLRSQIVLDFQMRAIKDINEIEAPDDKEKVSLIKEVLSKVKVNDPSSGMTHSDKAKALVALLEGSAKALALNKELRDTVIKILKELHSKCARKLDDASNEGKFNNFFRYALYFEFEHLENKVSKEGKLDEWSENALKGHHLFKAPMLYAVARCSYLLGNSEESLPFVEGFIEKIAEKRQAGELNDQHVRLVIKGLVIHIGRCSAEYRAITRETLVNAIRRRLLDAMTDMQAKKAASRHLEGAINQSLDKLLAAEISNLKDGESVAEKLDEWIEAALQGHPFKGAMLNAVARNTHSLGNLEDSFDFLNGLIEKVSQKHQAGELNNQDVSFFILGLEQLFRSSSPEHSLIADALVDATDQKQLDAMTDTHFKQETFSRLTAAISQLKNSSQT